MLILFDFQCQDCGHTQEGLVHHETRSVVCDECGGHSARLISPVRSKLDGTDPGFPGAYDKWARDHAKNGGPSEATLDERADAARKN